MDSFPSTLTPSDENKSVLSQLNHSHWLRELRKEIFLYIVKQDDRDYFDLDAFNKRGPNSKITMEEMTGQILGELKDLGWGWTICYGGTGIYLHHPEKKPSHAW